MSLKNGGSNRGNGRRSRGVRRRVGGGAGRASGLRISAVREFNDQLNVEMHEMHEIPNEIPNEMENVNNLFMLLDHQNWLDPNNMYRVNVKKCFKSVLKLF